MPVPSLSLSSPPFLAPKHRTSGLPLDWVTSQQEQIPVRHIRARPSPGPHQGLKSWARGPDLSNRLGKKVPRRLTRQALRFEAVSHLLAASQGALTAPLFGEGTRQQDRRERRPERQSCQERQGDALRVRGTLGQRQRVGKKGPPSPKGDRYRQKDPDNPRQERRAEKERGEIQAQGRGRGRGRGSEGRAKHAAEGLITRLNRRWSQGSQLSFLPTASPTHSPAPTWTKEEPMSCKIWALRHQSQLPLVDPTARAGCCYDSAGWRWAGMRGGGSGWESPVSRSFEPMAGPGDSPAPHSAQGPKLLQRRSFTHTHTHTPLLPSPQSRNRAPIHSPCKQQ